ncbi:MAG: SRPBCC family protein [Rubellimicrobium sp.]|nr:SRPBCC family protein [Rubellimicrobium sp.]
MEFTARQDIAATAEDVFAAFTDYAQFERQALRRGVEMRRMAPSGAGSAGPAWFLRFRLRGRDRELHLEVTECRVPELIELAGQSPGLGLAGTIDLLALSRNRTRVTVTVTLAARSVPARLALQTLRLARGRAQRRIDSRLADFARGIEARGAGAGAIPAPRR